MELVRNIFDAWGEMLTNLSTTNACGEIFIGVNTKK